MGYGNFGGFGGGNMQAMLRQAQKMQEDLTKAKANYALTTFLLHNHRKYLKVRSEIVCGRQILEQARTLARRLYKKRQPMTVGCLCVYMFIIKQVC